jgi:hypothetical protein
VLNETHTNIYTGPRLKDRLLALNLLPLAFGGKIKDLTFMFKTLHGFYDLDVFDFVSFVNHIVQSK